MCRLRHPGLHALDLAPRRLSYCVGTQALHMPVGLSVFVVKDGFRHYVASFDCPTGHHHFICFMCSVAFSADTPSIFQVFSADTALHTPKFHPFKFRHYLGLSGSRCSA